MSFNFSAQDCEHGWRTSATSQKQFSTPECQIHDGTQREFFVASLPATVYRHQYICDKKICLFCFQEDGNQDKGFDSCGMSASRQLSPHIAQERVTQQKLQAKRSFYSKLGEMRINARRYAKIIRKANSNASLTEDPHYCDLAGAKCDKDTPQADPVCSQPGSLV